MKIPEDDRMAAYFREFGRLQERVFHGFEHLLRARDPEVAPTPKERIHFEERMTLYHYVPQSRGARGTDTPLLIAYALVNRQYMMDLQADRSLISQLVGSGRDVYIIDWGYARPIDRYLTMEDYIDGYIGDCVDIVRQRHDVDAIDLMGVCQGGTFSTIYASLHPEKVKNLVVMVAPIDFHTDDGLLNVWARDMDIDQMVDVLGNIPGDFMNLGFLMLKPFQLMIDKYVGFTETMDEPASVENFLRMEKWIFDSPDQAGETIRKFIKDLYQGNKLVKGELEIGGRRVDLGRIDMPVLNIYGQKDHLVPPACSIPLNDLVASKDTQRLAFDLGHIGLYVSSKSQKELGPAIIRWLGERDGGSRRAARGPAARKPAPRKSASRGRGSRKKQS
jgi:polyhydroxyalkanoate synthase